MSLPLRQRCLCRPLVLTSAKGIAVNVSSCSHMLTRCTALSSRRPARLAGFSITARNMSASTSTPPNAPAAAAASPAKAKPAKAPKQAQQSRGPKAATAAAASSSAASRSVLLHPDFASVQLCDIGANLLDDMFQGKYRSNTPKHPADLALVLERAKQRGVSRIIVTAGSAEEGAEALNLISTLEAQAATEGRAFPQLYSTVGVHPTRSRLWNGSEKHQQQYFDQLLDAIMRGLEMPAAGAAASAASAASAAASSSAAAPARTHEVVVAVGECGLDYDRLHFSDKESQLRHFSKHFLLVERVAQLTADRPGGSVHLPLFLHDRNTDGDFLRIIQENRKRFRHGVVHSFTGSVELLKSLLALDLHIGINGCSLKTEENLTALDYIPLNRLLLETDAPWCDIRPTHASFPLVGTKLTQLRPEQWRPDAGVKGRCEVLEVVAARLGQDPVELAQQVWKNTHEVFFAREQQ